MNQTRFILSILTNSVDTEQTVYEGAVRSGSVCLYFTLSLHTGPLNSQIYWFTFYRIRNFIVPDKAITKTCLYNFDPTFI